MEPLLQQLRTDFPQVKFRPAQRFSFTPPCTVFYSRTKDSSPLLLLHELSHCLLQHRDYHSEVELLKMEAQAWQKAKTLAEAYQIPWDENLKDDYLDSYRDLLHRRSVCPTCQINGYFSPSLHQYICPSCNNPINTKIHP